MEGVNKMFDRIGIIGSGSGGRAIAGMVAKKGYKVILGYRTKKKVATIKKHKTLEVSGALEEDVKLESVTNNIQKLVQNSNIILVVVPANAHDAVMDQIAPYLVDGQIVLLNPGRTWGAINAYNRLKQLRPNLEIFIGETQTLLYTCRAIDDRGVHILKVKDEVDCCFYPESDNILMEDIVTDMLPTLNIIDDIRHTSLNNIGAIVHPATVLLNSGAISRQQEFLFYSEGMTRAVVNVLEAIDEERCTVIKRAGLESKSLLQWLEDVYGCYEDNLFDAFRNVSCYAGIKAPPRLEMRYVFEDVPTGLVPLASLGDYYGINTPNIDSIIQLASCMFQRDFMKLGRTIDRIGVPEEILHHHIIPDLASYFTEAMFS